MMNENIEAKKAEIANYERILREYQSGRWLDMGRRRLATLQEELAALEAQVSQDANLPLVSRGAAK